MPAARALSITDVHVHIQPWESFRPATLARMRAGRPDFDRIVEMGRDPELFLRYLDAAGVERACLINYPAPDVMGFGDETSDFALSYTSSARDRLLPVGGVHPRFSRDPAGDVARLADKGIRALKLHPPHMLVRAESHMEPSPEGAALASIYATAQERRLPIIIHTGTSVFPGARSRLGDPIGIDDVAVDYPDLRIIMAHGGRPLWSETCFFLMRRHPNVWLDLSGIPPRNLPAYFPRLNEISGRVLFGTDWPSPGVKEIGGNLEDFLGLPEGYLPDAAKRAIVQDNALALFPRQTLS